MNSSMVREIVTLRGRSLALLVLLALAVLGLFLYLSLWQEPQLERTQTEWFTKRDAAARGEDRGEAARYQEGERGLKEFESRIVTKRDFAAFLSELFALAKRDSLEIKGITYKPSLVKDEPSLITYTITFGVSGKYAGVKGFLADLARLPKLVTLDSVALDNSSRTEELVHMQVVMTVYLKTEGA